MYLFFTCLTNTAAAPTPPSIFVLISFTILLTSPNPGFWLQVLLDQSHQVWSCDGFCFIQPKVSGDPPAVQQQIRSCLGLSFHRGVRVFTLIYDSVSNSVYLQSPDLKTTPGAGGGARGGGGGQTPKLHVFWRFTNVCAQKAFSLF